MDISDREEVGRKSLKVKSTVELYSVVQPTDWDGAGYTETGA